MFKRNLQKKLEEALKRSPVVLLTGARQTGKTTLMRAVARDQDYSYVTFDDLRFLSAAQRDPLGFIQGLQKPVILDEVQRVPEIFLAIKHDVDENRLPGRYALTGSANPFLIPRLGDSLAGRMEIFYLHTLSQGELLSRYDDFIARVFAPEMRTPPYDLVVKAELHKKIAIGGYPSVLGFDYSARESWFSSYVTALLQRDVKDIANIAGLSELPMLLQLLATRNGTLLNAAELSRTSGIPSSTLSRYLVLLNALFLVELLAPWSAHLGKRLVKSPKVYLNDTGLLTYLLGMDEGAAAFQSPLGGHLLENFVFGELTKQATWSSVRVKLYHVRTIAGIEVDFVLENQAGQLVGIEVKNSVTVSASDFKGLAYLEQELKEKFVRGIVLYTGDQVVPFGKKLYAVPLSALWAAAGKSDTIIR